MSPRPQEWFKNWFNASYLELYSHRDPKQARLQVESLIELLGDRVDVMDLRLLDVGCGDGRHLYELMQSGMECWGVDLSLHLAPKAQDRGCCVAVADMRSLPFLPGTFTIITSFFSSFGYFSTLEEDRKCLEHMTELLENGGYLFLDLMNKKPAMRNLVESDEKPFGSGKVVQKRWLDGNVIVKDITIMNENGESESYQERLRLYGLDETMELVSSLGFEVQSAMGTERGDKYEEDNSPRMSLLMKKRD